MGNIADTLEILLIHSHTILLSVFDVTGVSFAHINSHVSAILRKAFLIYSISLSDDNVIARKKLLLREHRHVPGVSGGATPSSTPTHPHNGDTLCFVWSSVLSKSAFCIRKY